MESYPETPDNYCDQCRSFDCQDYKYDMATEEEFRQNGDLENYDSELKKCQHKCQKIQKKSSMVLDCFVTNQ
jgi:hypothetical protein